MDGLQPTVIFVKPAPIDNEFIGQVFESVAEFLQSASSLLRNSAPNIPCPSDDSAPVKRLHAKCWTVILRNYSGDFHDKKVLPGNGRMSLPNRKIKGPPTIMPQSISVHSCDVMRLTNNRTHND